MHPAEEREARIEVLKKAREDAVAAGMDPKAVKRPSRVALVTRVDAGSGCGAVADCFGAECFHEACEGKATRSRRRKWSGSRVRCSYRAPPGWFG